MPSLNCRRISLIQSKANKEEFDVSQMFHFFSYENTREKNFIVGNDLLTLYENKKFEIKYDNNTQKERSYAGKIRI